VTSVGPPPADWYADPATPGRLRYWDGRAWTAHLARANPAPASPADDEASGTDEFSAEPERQDLGANQPGQRLRELALELRRAAPVRTFIAQALGVHTQERAWRVGADGEEQVAMRLRTLGEGWQVIHGVPIGAKDSDIDHVVIGLPGVFTLNTKNHRGSKVWVARRSLLVNGKRTDYLENSRFEAARASKLLSAACGFGVPVEPIVVVIAATLTIKVDPSEVHVVGRKQIATWLSTRPPVLTPEAAEKIYEQARRDSTWRIATK
jgi:hypothetical protein